MKARRVYSKRRVFELLAEALVHGSYNRLLRREGIEPYKVINGTTYYDAAVIDELISAIKF